MVRREQSGHFHPLGCLQRPGFLVRMVSFLRDLSETEELIFGLPAELSVASYWNLGCGEDGKAPHLIQPLLLS